MYLPSMTLDVRNLLDSYYLLLPQAEDVILQGCYPHGMTYPPFL